MKNYENYFQNHSYGTDIKENSAKTNKEIDRKVGKYIRSNAKILEIGTGLGDFANFCLSKGVKNYTGIEIDKGIAKKLSKKFNKYNILCADALDFFKKTSEKYEIIFMSHVFEHFTIEEGIKLAKLISKHLTTNGIRINVMPNAGCISAGVARYNDITHKVIYTDNSFNQVLLEAGFKKENINHFNVYPNNFIKKLFFRLSGLFLSVPYNTFELMSVIKSKA